MDNTKDPNNPYPQSPIYNSSNPPLTGQPTSDVQATNPAVDPLTPPPSPQPTAEPVVTDPFNLPTTIPQPAPVEPAPLPTTPDPLAPTLPQSPAVSSSLPPSPDPLLNSTLPPGDSNTFNPPSSGPGLDSAISSWQQTPPVAPATPPLANAIPADLSSTPAAVDSYTATPNTPTLTDMTEPPPMPSSQTTPADINAALGAPVDNSPVPTWPPPAVNQSTDQATPAVFEEKPLETPNLAGEPAPTDLSQLTGSPPQPPQPVESYNPVSGTDNMVVPQPEQAVPETTTTQPFPLKLIIGGVITLLIITAASIYFFFFAGKKGSLATPPVESENQIPLNPPTAVPQAPIASSSADQTNEASSSFGSLVPSQSATPSAKPTSAIETLKQRQSE